jgi:hypothetical protein
MIETDHLVDEMNRESAVDHAALQAAGAYRQRQQAADAAMGRRAVELVTAMSINSFPWLTVSDLARFGREIRLAGEAAYEGPGEKRPPEVSVVRPRPALVAGPDFADAEGT